ncbi:ornithine transporter 1 [Rhizoctonia solani AG-1 IA]|uniref:Ornithine transporter 1 n=1 Tax=Thanatephorus cucumeris (strain AG1-IA) TaxID=983506 RepID=L8WZ86_THACA|nr:ornithine transporter 1 [Rhizoctonia solani AG-1 IA]
MRYQIAHHMINRVRKIGVGHHNASAKEFAGGRHAQHLTSQSGSVSWQRMIRSTTTLGTQIGEGPKSLSSNRDDKRTMAAQSSSLREILGPNVGIDLAAGSMGGVAQVIVGQPLDTIKTRAQIAPIALNSITGMASPLLGIAGVNSLLFASYAISKRIVSPFPELSLPEIAAAGAMAGAANSVLASPANPTKQVDPIKPPLRQATVAREIPAYAGFYTGYEFAKRKFRSKYGNQVPVWGLLASGSCGGVGFQTSWSSEPQPLANYSGLITLVDVVKSRVQLADTPPKGLDYIAQELRAIVREGGCWTVSRAFAVAIPAAASTFAAYELTKGELRFQAQTDGVY